MNSLISRLQGQLQIAGHRSAHTPGWISRGRITRATGLVLQATGLSLPVGAPCLIECGDKPIEAETVGFDGHTLFLMPLQDITGITPGARVHAQHATPLLPIALPPDGCAITAFEHSLNQASGRLLPVGPALLGRVLDGRGQPLDGLGPIVEPRSAPLYSPPINPLARAPIDHVLDVGVRAINGLLSVGRGQRMGLFAGSGVGKSVLLGMMARYTRADVIVVGLIGERGREVQEFIELNLGPEGRSRSVVVAAPADVSPLLRLQGAAYATRIAEDFRDHGLHVLLIMDSLTRYAMAQREISLAIGEPPATKGYPPSVFAKLPALVERAGNGAPGPDGQAHGSITAFYTVLAEGDDQQDPIADAARAILDGHIVLTRHLAEAGHYPAIDIEASISRVMTAITDAAQQNAARRFKQLFSRYQRSRDLIAVGAYAAGNDAQLDEAVAQQPRLESYLQQGLAESVSYEQANLSLQRLFQPGERRA
jgi:flagellum-specific ATP synthase